MTFLIEENPSPALSNKSPQTFAIDTPEIDTAEERSRFLNAAYKPTFQPAVTLDAWTQDVVNLISERRRVNPSNHTRPYWVLIGFVKK